MKYAMGSLEIHDSVKKKRKYDVAENSEKDS